MLSTELLPTRLVCKRYGVSGRTIIRWEQDPDLNFPKPASVINGRKYYSEAELTAFDRALVAQIAKRGAKSEAA